MTQTIKFIERKQSSYIMTLGLSLLVIFTIFLAGCANPNLVPPKVNTTIHTPVINVSLGNISSDNCFVDANNLLSFDLYDKYKTEDGNLFFSSYSIVSALAMTYEGARGQTAEEMRTVLHLPDSKETLRSDFLDVYSELNKFDKTYKLSTANALWAQEDYPFIEDYFNIVTQNYGGSITNLDFVGHSEESRITINDWVEERTNDKIKDLIPQGLINVNTRLVLTNAVYFKANWSKQFNAEDTFDSQFHLNSEETVDVKYMSKTSTYNYGETDSLQILEMDYLENDLSMLIILPKDNNVAQVENSFSLQELENWKNNMADERLRVRIPKFKFETKYFMAEDLAEMGMPTAFSNQADFTGMSETNELAISDVVHQTFIEVAEYGTEAAAATAVTMELTSVGPPVEQPKLFLADHPFIFIIQDKESGNILFMGRMGNPAEE